jgi:hypothetical protein
MNTAWAIPIAALALLAGCATTERLAAAPDVRALLVAIRDDDRAAFEAHVDRRALEAQIQAAVVARARRAGLGEGGTGLGLLLSGPLSRAAGGLLVQPEVFRAVADYYGYRPEQPIPGPLALAGALSALPDGRVCARGPRRGPCLLTFAEEDGVWRLVGFDAEAALSHSDRGARP